MVNAPRTPDADILAGFDLMIAGVPGAVRRGIMVPYVAINGNVYATVSKADVLGLRLDRDDLATFFNAYGAGPFESIPGLVTPEYAAVPRALFADVKSLHNWFRISHAYASRLPPKSGGR